MAASRFNDKSILVTGGASGIGRATALRLAAEGGAVMAVDVNADLLAKLSVDAEGLSGSIATLVGDVGSEAGVQSLVARSAERLGHLDVVVNVAGVLSFAHTHEVTLDEWNRLITINLTGTFLVCREAIPHLLATRGNIVNLASTAAHKGQPWATAYVASKGGVLALTRALAVEYAAAGLRANSISPGAIDTPITAAFHLPEGADAKLLRRVTPLGPFGMPEHIAAAIAYVASDEGAHMNGADLLIDGATLA
ncbi:MAG: SDR family oxidoreductase [Acidimicrobiales bacterium]|jgi:NAD(P)-dependent dehydrogenase (short-subunit alcohol dehydrogenase family)|nr:SDR family oxidoreductase [Acidimicrobiales bacterium]